MPQILEIMSDLLPGRSEYGNTHLTFTRPSKNRLYVKILQVLADGLGHTIDDIYESIPGTQCRIYLTWSPHDFSERTKKVKRWRSHSILGCLRAGGFVKMYGSDPRYRITPEGRAYLTAIEPFIS